MISAVIIVLREVLEAMLVICILLASSSALGINRRWLVYALAAGLAGAFSYAFMFNDISQLFEGFGQEIFNATMLIFIALSLSAYNLVAIWFLKTGRITLAPGLIYLALISSVSFAMTREGSEIYIYVYAYGIVADNISTVVSGGMIGAGIGLSLGIFIYYGLASLAPEKRIIVSCVLALLMTSGMLSKAVLYLIQADLLPAQLPLWDSSNVISESSLMGELLHAMLGYEANPTAIQVLVYLGSLLLFFAYFWLRFDPVSLLRRHSLQRKKS